MGQSWRRGEAAESDEDKELSPVLHLILITTP
jgi:hypothetical protein